MANAETKVDKIEAIVRRCKAHIVSMDDSLGRIEASFAALQDSVPRLSRAVPTLWLALAAAVAWLAVCAGG